ncbi:MAG: tryptophan synthase subunit alpha [Alteromonadaceae bacterium]|nr:MAG: tryptophan synthase subunit alpha [Alteromonadaceae bacterium]
MSQRYQQLFADLKQKNQGAFVPFVTIGDPSLELSAKIIDTLVEGGADALELGIPFSDPVADGPTIQAANVRALNAGVTPPKCIELIAGIRKRHPDIPIGLLLYANLAYTNGIEAFYTKLADAGVDSVLIADVPAIESAQFRAAAKKTGIDSVFIAPPNANEDTLAKVAEYGQGYTYLLSRAGVTGAENVAGKPIVPLVNRLTELGAPPCLLGFGISTPEQVKDAIDAGAAGAISGSAPVRIIEANVDDPEKMLAELLVFIQNMKKGTHK